MKRYDRMSSLFWLLLAGYVCVVSLKLGVGTPRNPGMGFMTFGSSVLWGLLASVLFFRTFLPARGATKSDVVPFGASRWKVVCVLAALVMYAALLSSAGYLVATFLLMAFLFWILKGTRWWWVLGGSFLTTLSTYYVFSKGLNCQFPDGLLGF